MHHHHWWPCSVVLQATLHGLPYVTALVLHHTLIAVLNDLDASCVDDRVHVAC
jgi:hypothetical protein